MVMEMMMRRVFKNDSRLTFIDYQMHIKTRRKSQFL